MSAMTWMWRPEAEAGSLPPPGDAETERGSHNWQHSHGTSSTNENFISMYYCCACVWYMCAMLYMWMCRDQRASL